MTPVLRRENESETKGVCCMLTKLPGMESFSQFSGIPNDIDTCLAGPLLIYKIPHMN